MIGPFVCLIPTINSLRIMAALPSKQISHLTTPDCQHCQRHLSIFLFLQILGLFSTEQPSLTLGNQIKARHSPALNSPMAYPVTLKIKPKLLSKAGQFHIILPFPFSLTLPHSALATPEHSFSFCLYPVSANAKHHTIRDVVLDNLTKNSHQLPTQSPSLPAFSFHNTYIFMVAFFP